MPKLKMPEIPTSCPVCGITWEGDEIPDGLHRLNPTDYPTAEAALEGAKAYGWTPDNRLKFNINVIGIETPDYDGISYWRCEKCKINVDRFTGEVE